MYTKFSKNLAVALICAMSIAMPTAYSASAVDASGGNPPPTDGGSKGRGVHTIKYDVSYVDPIAGEVRCTGVHQTGKNFPGYGQDSFTCESTTGQPLLRYSPGQVVTLVVTGGGWWSDYYFFIKNQVVWATSLYFVVSDDGMSYSGVATYY